MTDEEIRAAEFRRVQQARASYREAQRHSLFPSDAGAIARFRQNWLPWTDPVRDWDPVAGDEGRGLQVP